MLLKNLLRAPRFPSLRTLALSLPLLGMAACDGDGNASDFAVVPEVPVITDKAISGSIEGLRGTLTLSWLDRSQALGPGAFSIFPAFDSDVPAETSFTITVSEDPVGQTCTITTPAAFVNVVDDVTGVQIVCEDQNVMRVSVANFFTGEAIPDIDYTYSWFEQGNRVEFAGRVGADGTQEVELPLFEGRIVVNTDIDGFGEQSTIVYNTATAATREARLLMQNMNLGASFDATAGGDLIVGGEVLVTIPPNALVDAQGNPYTGIVTAELTVVDPTVDLALMPGDYLSEGAGGAIRPIQSYGALSLTLVGSAGEVLDLGAGQLATVNIPVATAELGTSPPSVPFFSYDRTDGYYVEESSGTLTTLTSGTSAYQGQVSHFTTWNSDVAFDPVFVNGCVVTPAGAPFPNVRVDARGVNYLGASVAVSDANGNFRIAVRPASSNLISAGDGLQSRTLQADVAAADITLTDCLEASAGASTITLTWGENPRDLDTHFFGISTENSADNFHIDYTNRNVTVQGIELFLDVDDVTSFGPEIVTIPDFPFVGTYRYGVHLFSGSGTIASSPARVELNLAGEVSVYTPPNGSPTECWAVFDVLVDAAGFRSVTPINSWEPESWCTQGNFGSTNINSDSGVAFDKAPNPLAGQIREKYYR